MDYVFVVIGALVLSTIVTLIILQGYGVNMDNWAVFKRLVRLKSEHAKSDVTGGVVYDYVVKRLDGNKKGRCDVTFAEVLTEPMFEDAMSVVISRLLDNGYKPVSLSRSEETVEIIIGE